MCHVSLFPIPFFQVTCFASPSDQRTQWQASPSLSFTDGFDVDETGGTHVFRERGVVGPVRPERTQVTLFLIDATPQMNHVGEMF